MLLDGPPSWRQRGRPQPIDEAEDFSEQLPRHRNLRQLERDVSAMMDDLGTDLHQFLPQRGQRPVLDLLRQSQRPHEVGEIVSQGVKLEANGIVAERPTRQPRPLDGVLAFLDELLRLAPLIVERHHPLGRAAQVGDDEADTGVQLAGMPLDLGDDPALPVPRACLIAETGMEAPNVVGRAAEGTSEQMGDTFLKNRVGLKTDRVLVALGFQELVEVRQGKGGIPPKVAA